MRRLTLIFLVIGFSLLGSGYTASGTYCPLDPNRPHIAGAETIVLGYLDAVDRGELRIFNRKLERSEIIPVRVEYIYEIAKGKMEIRVYSNLKEPAANTNQPGSKVYGVNSTIEDGRIVETESHVWID